MVKRKENKRTSHACHACIFEGRHLLLDVISATTEYRDLMLNGLLLDPATHSAVESTRERASHELNVCVEAAPALTITLYPTLKAPRKQMHNHLHNQQHTTRTTWVRLRGTATTVTAGIHDRLIFPCAYGWPIVHQQLTLNMSSRAINDVCLFIMRILEAARAR